MELKLPKKKYITEDNLKRIVKVGISFGERLNSIESACIEDFSESKNYLRGDACYKDGYIYRAVVSTTGAWVESRWTKVGDEFTELTKEDIEAMLNLSQEELDNLQKLLKDDQITTTSTFSSSKIYSDLQAAIDTAKEYTNNQLGKAVKPAYKVVASTSEVTETGYFYLISNGTNFDMYVLSADGTVVSLGTSDVDLSDYAKTTDLEADYLKKTDADGKFATITTVDGKVDKTSIATAISSTPSDDKVPSEKAVYDKNTINHKTVNGVDILDYASKQLNNFEFVRGFNVINSPYGDTDSPNNDMLYMINRIDVSGHCRITAYDLRSQFTYMNTQGAGSWSGWVRLTFAGGTEDYQTLATPQIKDNAFMSLSVLAGTDRDFMVFDINKSDRTVRRLQFDTVEKAIGMYDLDYNTNAITEVGTLRFSKNSYVPPTNITPADTTTFINFNNSLCNYCVKNGVCYVNLEGISIAYSGKMARTGVYLPKSTKYQGGTFLSGGGDATPHAYVFVLKDTGELCFDVKDANTPLYGSFSYPVAEE